MFELVINLKTAKASIVCSIFTTTILVTILAFSCSPCLHLRRSLRNLAEEVDLSQVDDFVSAAAEHRFEHEEAEAGHLLQRDRRRH